MDQEIKDFGEKFSKENSDFCPKVDLFDKDRKFFNKIFVLYNCMEIAAWGDCISCPFYFDHTKENFADADCRTLAMAWAAKQLEEQFVKPTSNPL